MPLSDKQQNVAGWLAIAFIGLVCLAVLTFCLILLQALASM